MDSSQQYWNVPNPGAILADKIYDSDATGIDLDRCDINPVIAIKANRKIQRVLCQKSLRSAQSHRALLQQAHTLSALRQSL